MITTNSISQTRKQIQELLKENKQVVVLAADDEYNRKIFENKDVDLVIGLEFDKKDYLKQRNSGLNEILCKLAKKNNITIGIDINKIKKLNKIEKARVLARVMQNITLSKRVGNKIIILGEADKQETLSFFLTLGGSTQQINSPK